MAGGPGALTDADVQWLKSLKMSRRAAIVRDHILKYGSVTTRELEELYGYKHPPRAAADLRDAGAGVATTMVIVDGARMASYSFTGAANQNGAGRVVIPKPFADELKAAYGHRCNICSGIFEDRELQSDHRIPFRIAGDQPVMVLEDFQPLCASDNRAKSWSCEHCPNWTVRDMETCRTCFWASPEDYEHVGTRRERRVSLVFQDDEADVIDQYGPPQGLAALIRDKLLRRLT